MLYLARIEGPEERHRAVRAWCALLGQTLFVRLLQANREARLQAVEEAKHEARCRVAHRSFDPIYLGA